MYTHTYPHGAPVDVEQDLELQKKIEKLRHPDGALHELALRGDPLVDVSLLKNSPHKKLLGDLGLIDEVGRTKASVLSFILTRGVILGWRTSTVQIKPAPKGFTVHKLKVVLLRFIRPIV